MADASPTSAPKPGAASGAIRGLFVGVDEYLYSRARLETAEFGDLHGAVNDVAQIKHALRTAYRLDLDRPSAGCSSSNPVSIRAPVGGRRVNEAAQDVNAAAAAMEPEAGDDTRTGGGDTRTGGGDTRTGGGDTRTSGGDTR